MKRPLLILIVFGLSIVGMLAAFLSALFPERFAVAGVISDTTSPLVLAGIVLIAARQRRRKRT